MSDGSAGFRARGEEAIGDLAQALLENPLFSQALGKALGAGERAAQAQRAALGALDVSERQRPGAARPPRPRALRSGRGARGRARRDVAESSPKARAGASQPRVELEAFAGFDGVASASAADPGELDQGRLEGLVLEPPARRAWRRRAARRRRRPGRRGREQAARSAGRRRQGPGGSARRAAVGAAPGQIAAAHGRRRARPDAASERLRSSSGSGRELAAGLVPSATLVPSAAIAALDHQPVAQPGDPARRGAGPDPDRRRAARARPARRRRPPRSGPPIPVDWTVSSAPDGGLAVVAPEAAVVVAHPRLDEQALGDRQRPGGIAAEQGVRRAVGALGRRWTGTEASGR